MDSFHRISLLHLILSGRRTPVSSRELQARLECSAVTVKRLIRKLRDYLDVPVVYDRQRNGYFCDRAADPKVFELPGLGFNADELWGLITCHTLLQNLSGGLLTDQIAALQRKVEKLLMLDDGLARRKLERIKIAPMAMRKPDFNSLFRTAALAVFSARRIRIRYAARSSGEIFERTVSPQTLVYYRDNWYLDGWCHVREALRTFAVERIQAATMLDADALSLEREALDQHFSATYGIFPGPARHWAVLKFSAERARWVSEEHWHSAQKGHFLDDGGYELSVPFGDHRELLMDILRHGRHVEVVAPEFLRDLALREIQAMMGLYEKKFSP